MRGWTSDHGCKVHALSRSNYVVQRCLCWEIAPLKGKMRDIQDAGEMSTTTHGYMEPTASRLYLHLPPKAFKKTETFWSLICTIPFIGYVPSCDAPYYLTMIMLMISLSMAGILPRNINGKKGGEDMDIRLW